VGALPHVAGVLDAGLAGQRCQSGDHLGAGDGVQQPVDADHPVVAARRRPDPQAAFGVRQAFPRRQMITVAVGGQLVEVAAEPSGVTPGTVVGDVTVDPSGRIRQRVGVQGAGVGGVAQLPERSAGRLRLRHPDAAVGQPLGGARQRRQTVGQSGLAQRLRTGQVAGLRQQIRRRPGPSQVGAAGLHLGDATQLLRLHHGRQPVQRGHRIGQRPVVAATTQRLGGQPTHRRARHRDQRRRIQPVQIHHRTRTRRTPGARTHPSPPRHATQSNVCSIMPQHGAQTGEFHRPDSRFSGRRNATFARKGRAEKRSHPGCLEDLPCGGRHDRSARRVATGSKAPCRDGVPRQTSLVPAQPSLCSLAVHDASGLHSH